MPKKKDIVRAGASQVPRIRENSRLMRTHESMVDYISGRTSAGNILDMFGPALFGFNYFESLHDDIIYSSDDDYDDDDDVPFSSLSGCGPNRTLEPHPQIKQLTDEEADRIAKELMEEEKRNKDKTERNKRKKKRKKEKKRLEKENALKEIISEEDREKSNSSENLEQIAVIGSISEVNESSKSNHCEVTAEADKSDENSNYTEEKSLVRTNEEDNQQKVSDQKPTKEEKDEEEHEVAEVRQPEEKKPDVAVPPELPKKMEPETSNEKTASAVTDEFAKRSIDLANMGNRLAAAGQYETAVNCFTDAIKFNPREFKLFGNRSLCYERLQQYKNALRDADVALSMEPNWIKGLFRKGKALCGLKRYYEASLIYKEVLKLESKSAEAAQELKRAQTLHLMEMGFSWAQSSEALKTHATLEEAVEALFAGDGSPDAGASGNKSEQPVEQEDDKNDDDDDDDEEGDWIVLQSGRPHKTKSDPADQTRLKSQWPMFHPKSLPKPELFPVWVRTLAPDITYVKLHEVFSRAGRVFSIKMLLDYGCAYVNYTRKEDCDRAIELINGMVVDGAPLSVQYPGKNLPKPAASKLDTSENSRRPGPYKRECFFWRTTGCTRDDCTFRHVPEHKNIDRDKFTGRLGYFSHANNHK